MEKKKGSTTKIKLSKVQPHQQIEMKTKTRFKV